MDTDPVDCLHGHQRTIWPAGLSWGKRHRVAAVAGLNRSSSSDSAAPSGPDPLDQWVQDSVRSSGLQQEEQSWFWSVLLHSVSSAALSEPSEGTAVYWDQGEAADWFYWRAELWSDPGSASCSLRRGLWTGDKHRTNVQAKKWIYPKLIQDLRVGSVSGLILIINFILTTSDDCFYKWQISNHFTDVSVI